METRTIEETKIYYLSLQDMREGKDRILPVVAFDEYSKLEEWVKAQKRSWKSESEGGVIYNKKFRKETPLEWYYPPKSMEPIEFPTGEGFVGFTWLRKNESETNPYDLKIPLNPPLPCTQ